MLQVALPAIVETSSGQPEVPYDVPPAIISERFFVLFVIWSLSLDGEQPLAKHSIKCDNFSEFFFAILGQFKSMASKGGTWSFDPWRKLGVAFGASINEVKAAWKQKRKNHPDKCTENSDKAHKLTEEFQILSVCFEYLSTEATRACFMDRWNWAGCWSRAQEVMGKIRDAENRQQEDQERERLKRKEEEERRRRFEEAEYQRREEAKQRRLDMEEAEKRRQQEVLWLRQENERLRRSEGLLQKQLQEKTAEASALSQKRAEDTLQISQLKNKLEEKERQAKTLRNATDAWRKTANDRKAQAAQSKSLLDTANAKLKDQMRRHVDQLREATEKQERIRHHLENELHKLQQRLQSEMEDNVALQHNWQMDVEELNAAASDKYEHLCSENNDLKMLNQVLQVENHQLQIEAMNVAQEELEPEPETMEDQSSSSDDHSQDDTPMSNPNLTNHPEEENNQPLRQEEQTETHEEAKDLVGYTCSCTHPFANKRNLMRHINSFKDEFPCSICGKVFGRRDLTKRHEKEVHKKIN